ncbi:MAG TPA: hypothetical protein VF626_01875, partial [Chthoniobacterales bacterium]
MAGLVAQYKPLVSTRPPVSAQKSVQVIADQDVEARLWQDPIAVAQKQKILDDAEIKTTAGGDRSNSHDITALAQLLRKRFDRLKKRTETADQHILLLGVMLEAGPYSELAEARLRARRAVLEGLSESGFVPRDGEHIGYVTTSWPPQEPVTLPEPGASPEPRASPNDRTLLIPWEECEAVAKPKRASPPDARPSFRRIFVLWLPAVNFSSDPLSRFAALVEKLAPGDLRETIKVKLLGPVNSTGLLSMIREVRQSAEVPQSPLDQEKTQ